MVIRLPRMDLSPNFASKDGSLLAVPTLTIKDSNLTCHKDVPSLARVLLLSPI